MVRVRIRIWYGIRIGIRVKVGIIAGLGEIVPLVKKKKGTNNHRHNN